MKSPIKIHGGKSQLVAELVKLIPTSYKRYLEGCCGGMNLLLNLPCEGISEWANDLNGELTNFWRVLRDSPEPLIRSLLGTPMSMNEYLDAAKTYGNVTDEQSKARAFFVRSRMSRQGLGKDYATPTKRQRRGMNEQVSAYWGAVEGLPEVHARIRRVEIWNLPVVKAIKKLDGKDLFAYFDPPYMPETRTSKGEYGAFEMTPEQHEELLDALASMKGKFMLSGYHSPLYDATAMIEGWNCHEIEIVNSASARKKKEVKVECVWTNY